MIKIIKTTTINPRKAAIAPTAGMGKDEPGACSVRVVLGLAVLAVIG